MVINQIERCLILYVASKEHLSNILLEPGRRNISTEGRKTEGISQSEWSKRGNKPMQESTRVDIVLCGRKIILGFQIDVPG